VAVTSSQLVKYISSCCTLCPEHRHKIMGKETEVRFLQLAKYVHLKFFGCDMLQVTGQVRLLQLMTLSGKLVVCQHFLATASDHITVFNPRACVVHVCMS
jgi:hypothetical protein